MRALLDVNVLLALLDSAHVHHSPARQWFAGRTPMDWASCPLTQNGFVRIISQATYPLAISVSQAVSLLDGATSTAWHEFWPDDVSLLDPTILDRSRIYSPRKLTDAYLLALAVRHGGCLVTFDQNIPVAAVPNASAANLIVL